MGDLTEARRQAGLVAALLSPERPTQLPEGLAALPGRVGGGAVPALAGLHSYRANGLAVAHRALVAAYPTVAAMLGDEALRPLARDLWWRHPPRCGDLARWGAEWPELLASHAALVDWPWLADCARLDWSVHGAALSVDPGDGVAGLALLGEQEPEALQLLLAPGAALIDSVWPLAELWAAHHVQPPDVRRAEQALAQVESVRQRTTWVWRQGWRVAVADLPLDQARLMRALAEGRSLGAALDEAGPDFDFQTWLITALQGGWLAGVQLLEMNS